MVETPTARADGLGKRKYKMSACENTATYCPEDDKLRLYVGRVPREEYLKLKAEGWTSTPKQDCDFSAVWTPERESTALEYAGIIDDEDQDPTSRAADRAERFSIYREKRRGEAGIYADAYDNEDPAHGFQNQSKAEKMAARHDLKADKACNAWSKAEYWQRRTAGVISNALYKSAPSVRMGRIKKLESFARKYEKAGERLSERGKAWALHISLRLQYENQMLEAQGGRAAELEMVPGGICKGGVIAKVNKSPATGRVVSVLVIIPKVEGYHYQISNVKGTEYALMKIETERLPPDAYREPTEESLARLEAYKTAAHVGAAPLLNPTKADAVRLQAIFNTNNGNRRPSEVVEMTAAEYTARAARCDWMGTVQVDKTGAKLSRWHETTLPPAFKIRAHCHIYEADQVILLTDKPQKALPLEIVAKVAPAAVVYGKAVQCELL